MNPNVLEQYANEYGSKRKKKKIAIALAVLVMFLTFYILVLPALTLEKDTYCGHEAHSHSEEAGCYKITDELICGKEESEEHQHSEECYKKELACDIEVHEHSLQCYSNPEADIETAVTWESDLSEYELTGNWSKDIVKIAETQVGYSESEKNYDVIGKEIKNGYTRFGDWYGDKYGDWCAMFCSFCMHYSAVDESIIPYSANCQEWIDALKEIDDEAKLDTDKKLYHGKKYEPKVGDLVFFDWDTDSDENISDHVGIVAELIYEDEKDVKDGEEPKLLKIRTIEGNATNADSMDSVRDDREYSVDSDYIMGYAKMPENPDVENTPVRVSDIEEVTDTVGDRIKEKEEEKAKETVKESETDVAENKKSDSEKAEPKKKVMKSRLLGSGNSFDVPVSYLGSTDGITFDATWEDDIDSILTGFNVSIYNTFDKPNITFAYDAAGSNSWTTIEQKTKVTKETNQTFTNNKSDFTLASKWKIDNVKDKDNSKSYGPFSVYDVLESIKPGFDDWLRNSYRQDFGGTSLPDDIDSLYDVFSMYYDMPAATVEKTEYDSNGAFDLSVTLKDKSNTDITEGNYTYTWQYLDPLDNTWKTLKDNSGNPITDTEINNANTLNILGDGGKKVRCRVIDSDGSLVSVSNTLYANAEQKTYDETVSTINSGLGLSSVTATLADFNGQNGADGTITTSTGSTYNLSIDGSIFNNNFYWKNVANDPDVPFEDPETFKNYLIKTYLDAKKDGKSDDDALAAVRKEWNKYIYDLFDPDALNLGGDATQPYPQTKGKTYGDDNFEWPKDEKSSFHSNNTGNTGPALYDKDNAPDGMLKPLDYDFLEAGVKYDEFVDNMKKEVTVPAGKAGDANTDRKYNVDISAETQAQGTGPVALILQIQTSWQLFDLEHANALVGDGTTVKGASSYNTQMANLYAIKHALIDFADYMNTKYPGNNLFLGITEVQHGGPQTMFLSSDKLSNNGKTSHAYVTNNYEKIKEGLYQWDSFGNCEHVHYNDGALQAACSSLVPTLSNIQDYTGFKLKDEDIRKVAVIVGGPTEMSNGNDGYGCALTWSNFATSGINSVYAMRVNDGVPITTSMGTSPYVSWLDNTSNSPVNGTKYHDGVGNTFTEYYTTFTEEQVYNTLIEIAEKEMNQSKIDLPAENAVIDDVELTDTIRNEFVLDKNATIEAVIYEKGTTTVAKDTTPVEFIWDATSSQWVEKVSKVPAADKGLIIENNDDGTTTVTYTFPTVGNQKQPTLHFGIVAKDDYIGSNNVFTNEGTPDLSYTHTPTGKDTQSFDKDYTDTPEVNVPIRVKAGEGGNTTVPVGTTVELAELDSDNITQATHDLLEKYGQINGKVTYSWVLPDGTEKPVNGIAVEVENGKVVGDWSIDDMPNEDDLEEHYTPTEAGKSTAKLKVIFTPDNVNDNGNFSNQETATAVGSGNAAGNVYINAVELGDSQNVYIRKVWSPETPDAWKTVDAEHTLQFVLKAKIKDVNDDYYVIYDATNEEYVITQTTQSNAATFDLTYNDAIEDGSAATDTWQKEIMDLPTMVKIGGTDRIVSYELIETSQVPGYVPEFSSTSVTEKFKPYVFDATVAIQDSAGKHDNCSIRVYYTANGKSDSVVLSGISVPKAPNTVNITLKDIPALSETQAGSITIDSVKLLNAKGAEEPNKNQHISTSGSVSTGSVHENLKARFTINYTAEKNIDNKEIEVKYTYNGTPYTYKEKVTAKKDDVVTIVIDNLPVNTSTNPVSAYTPTITSFKVDGDNKLNKLVTTTPAGEVYSLGGSSETKPVLTVTNSDARRTVIIKKVVEKQSSDEVCDKVFHFTATLSGDNVFPTPDPDANYTVDTDNDVHFDLHDGEEIEIVVPHGSDLTITEENPEGYYPLIKEYCKEGISGDNATFTILKDDTELTVYNTTGYELPKTGGTGTWIFTLGGALLIVIALMWMISLRRRSERGLE